MEAFADNAATEGDLLAFNSTYDPSTNSFQGGNVPVRQVVERRIPAYDKQTKTSSDSKFDTFSGIIDGVTGKPLYGTRIYILTGEVYEGPFENGKRHGDSAIVKNIDVPKVDPQLPQEFSELSGNNVQVTNLSFLKANFFGSYVDDEPFHGTLVTDSFSYRGSFLNGKFSGIRGELVHSSGYRYEGEFQEGFFHGTGREIIPSKGEYQGEFQYGMRHGMGTFKEYVAGEDSENIEMPVERTPLEIQVEVSELFSAKKDENGKEQEERFQEDFHPKRYTYSGFYRCNMQHGEGTEWMPDGETFSGHFLADRRHGHGILKKDGTTYESQWRAGSPMDGNGWRILFSNGDTYQGHVVDFKPEGYGIFTNAQGDVYSGDWRKGRRHGNGIHSDTLGAEFSGEWKDDVQVSAKRLEETDGTLSAIAKTLRITDNAPNTGEVTGEGADEPKHEKQLAFLKQAMSKSIESSLQIIAQQHPVAETEYFCFMQEKPQTKRSRSKSRDDCRAELHAYANGDTYLGALDPDSLHRSGYGVYVSKSTGCTYTGQFKNNLRHGYGILIHSQFGKYAGDFVDDKKHGIGTLILSDASSYHGGFNNGCFDGKGTLCERNGAVYVGDWKSGLRDGEGMETTPSGSIYKGHFKHGNREGHGTLLEKSGGKIIYSGDWRDGKYHGEGVLVERINVKKTGKSDPQMKFEGAFRDGQKHGYGVLTSGETVCKGLWSHDLPVSGKWRMSFRDGSIYNGQARVLEQGTIVFDQTVALPDGFGTMKYTNNDVFAGHFELGIRSGVGTCVFASGDQWEGDWIDDHIDKKGNGILTKANGQIHKFSKNSLGNIFSMSDQHLQRVMDQP